MFKIIIALLFTLSCQVLFAAETRLIKVAPIESVSFQHTITKWLPQLDRGAYVALTLSMKNISPYNLFFPIRIHSDCNGNMPASIRPGFFVGLDIDCILKPIEYPESDLFMYAMKDREFGMILRDNNCLRYKKIAPNREFHFPEIHVYPEYRPAGKYILSLAMIFYPIGRIINITPDSPKWHRNLRVRGNLINYFPANARVLNGIAEIELGEIEITNKATDEFKKKIQKNIELIKRGGSEDFDSNLTLGFSDDYEYSQYLRRIYEFPPNMRKDCLKQLRTKSPFSILTAGVLYDLLTTNNKFSDEELVLIKKFLYKFFKPRSLGKYSTIQFKPHAIKTIRSILDKVPDPKNTD